MPDKNVQLPDGRVVAFPDSMSDADIAAAIKTHLSTSSVPDANAQAKADLQKIIPDEPKVPLPLLPGAFPGPPAMSQSSAIDVMKQNAISGAGMVSSAGASELPLLARLGITTAAAGGTSLGLGNSPKESLKEGVTQGAFPEVVGSLMGVGGQLLSKNATGALARILRLSPKAFQFGREPAQEVLERGLAKGTLPEIKASIGEASKQVTSDLNDALKATKGTVNVENAALDVANNLPGTAGQRFLKVVDDAAAKLGFRTNQLSSLSAADTNLLKQEVAKQSKFVEGDLRPSVANGGKVFGGRLKDEMVKLNPDVKDLLESSANLTEASKGADFAVRAEKAGQGKGLLGGVQVNKPSTYLRAITDRPGAPQTLYRIASALKEHTPISNALRLAYSLVYGSGDEQ